jgi:hypothetical protein
VDKIERGYADLVDEYTNDLACRDWIHLVWPMVTDDVRNAYIGQLQAIDQRFVAATLEDGGQALSNFYRVENKSGWWWRRRPARVVGAMARAFRMADEDEVPPDRLLNLLRGDSESEVACRDLIRAGAKCVLHARDPARIDRLIGTYSRRLRHAKRAATVTVGLEEAIVALGASDEDQVLLGYVDDPAGRWISGARYVHTRCHQLSGIRRLARQAEKVSVQDASAGCAVSTLLLCGLCHTSNWGDRPGCLSDCPR